MDIKELENFNLADAVKFHDELNPALWTDKGRLDPEVHERLMDIAKDFMAYLGLSSLKVEDITISGSNAAYSYTPHSDLDLHLLVDYDKLPDDEVYKELFNAKKTIYNDKHDIKVRGVPVELYVQDSNQPHHSLGEYSILKKDWIKMPIKRRANFDQSATKAKYEKLGELIELAIKTRSLKRVDKALDIVRRYRKAGLEKTGEFGPENLAFKAIRKQGLFQELWDLKNELRSEELSIENVNEILDKDSAAKNIYWSKENYHITGGRVSQMYTLYTAAAQDKNKNILKYNFYNFPKHDLTAVEFSRAVGPWGDGFGVDNAGDQYTVFSTLLKTVEEYLSKHETKFIMFGAKEPSRAKLYQTFVNRFASKFGYKQINPDSIPKPVSSIILNSDDTPFLLQKIGTESVKEASGYIPESEYFFSMEFDPKIKKKILATKINNSTASCQLESKRWAKLLNKAGYEVEIHHGFYYPEHDLDDPEGHTWLEVEGSIFDPTAWLFSDKGHGEYQTHETEDLNEASGYIPSKKEKNDPRFKTALTVDVKPDSIKKNAKAFNSKISRAGIPPKLNTSGKV